MRSLLLSLSFCALGAQAQMTAITNDGRRVMLNPDGTWKAIDLLGTASAVDTSCATLIINGTDVAGKPTTSSQLMVVSYDGGTTGIAMVLDGGMKGGRTTWHLTCAGAKNCVTKDAKVKIFFRDGTSETVVSDAEENCKGIVPIHMGGNFGKKDLMTALSAKQVRTVRIFLGDDLVERDLSEENSLTLMHSARCLLR